MSIISYAQNLEDVMLWRALGHIKEGFYIDVGAAWPEMHSVTCLFYNSGWHGINIEPNQDLLKQLEEKRPRDINIGKAIGDQIGSKTMSFVSDGGVVNFGLTTLDPRTLADYEKHGMKLEPTEVEVTRLENITAEFVPPEQEVHFLKVDVEGLEKAVLAGVNWDELEPWIVIVEATKPMTQDETHEEWENILIKASYSLAYCDGLNRFYVSSEHSELMEAFKYPPNVFDDFESVTQNQLRIKTNQLQILANQIPQLELEVGSLRSELNHIRSSRSWRITAPLRTVLKWFDKENKSSN